jgi:predicted dehydrogenase
VDLGIHVLEMALYLLGDPDVLTVSASTFSHLASQRNFDIEDLATAFLRCSNGATLLLEASYATHSSVQDEYGVTLYGTTGGAEFHVKNYGTTDTLRFFHDVAGEPVDSASRVVGTDGFLTATREFVANIQQGNWSAHTGQRGLHIARLIDACYLSAQQGREIALAELR